MKQKATTRSLVTLAAIAAIAVGSVSACASSSATPAGQTVPTGSSTAVPVTPLPSPSINPGGTDIPVPPSSGSGSATAGGQTFDGTGYTSNGDVLTVDFYAGICEKYGLKADQSTAGRVVVTVVVTKHAPAGQMCSMVEVMQHVSANLGSPLDGRTVIDSATGKALPQNGTATGGHFYTPGPVKESAPSTTGN